MGKSSQRNDWARIGKDLAAVIDDSRVRWTGVHVFVMDTNVLLSDILNGLCKSRRTALLHTMQAGTVRVFAAEHV